MSKPNRRGYSNNYRSDNSKHNRYGKNREQTSDDTEESAAQNDFQTRKQTRGRPAGLSGKEIGLYYKDLAMKKRSGLTGACSSASRSSLRDTKYFSLDPDVERMIKSSLETVNTSYGKGKILTIVGDKPKIEDKYTHIRDSEFKRNFLNIISISIQEKLAKSMSMKVKLVKNESLDEQLKEDQKLRKSAPEYVKMMDFRRKLPSYKMKEEILKTVDSNQVVVISGETGCGKTTQIPQFILDDAIEKGNGSRTKIICTQPRRISAISVAERVAFERAENPGKSVGYAIRLEKTEPRDYGSILFCTTGILLKYMQSDPALLDYSHIVLDEIHERNTESDFIITLLKQVIPKRPNIKIILMSATLNAERFSQYYELCPIINIPGFTYPVSSLYLEDVIQLTRFKFPPPPNAPTNYKKHLKPFKEKQKQFEDFNDFIEPALRQMEFEKSYPPYVINELRNPTSEELSLGLIQALLQHISETKETGAILVFLPGIMDITNLCKNLSASGRFPSHKFQIYPLHSRLPTVEQKLIFKIPPAGIRKIIIATSIAETSITIEDVVYVIDCGKTKLTRFDAAKNIEILKPEWISLANARQRRGRAGRVQPGVCYHLFSKAREMTFEEYPTPEMLRTPLEQVILQVKILQLGRVDVFLGSVMDPPEEKAIEVALNLLKNLNALDNNETLTPLGYHLARLPLDPRTGKMILWASMFSCVEPVFAIAASLSFKDAFYCPINKEEEVNAAKLKLGLGQFSDHIALAEALRQFEKGSDGQTRRFCSDHFLSSNILRLLTEMKQQFTQYLYEMKFLDSSNPSDERANKNSHNLEVVKAIVCAGLYPNIAIVQNTGSFVKLKTVEDGTVKIHPGSINAREKKLPTSYVTYFLKQKSTAIFLHDTTCVNETALIFATPQCLIRPQGIRSIITLNQSISFICKQSTAEIIKKLKNELNQLLEHKINHPEPVKWESQEGDVLRAIVRFISQSNGGEEENAAK
ncbi:ATP-dependent DNA/RNA helicase DHX36 [Microplitis mediator]|uniref:ATP-dependent DNA/RNA helicase DHX36 n=1 Tax=Microplitis mediator TaxID=375433 RepID=UPI002555A09F|nr:ATP-dependent DNA/RNA helicase DHX36 [Microplitis mediator]